MASDLYQVNDDGSIILAVHAQPGAGRTEIAGRHGAALKVRVAAPPDAGRANDALRKALAGALGVADSAVELVSGERSRAKRFRIEGLEPDALDKVVHRLAAGPAPSPGASHRDRHNPGRR